jgi:signal transduction histidine kinase
MAAEVGTRRARAAGGAPPRAPRRADAALMGALAAAAAALDALLLVLLAPATRLPPGDRAGVAIVMALGTAFAGLGLFAWRRRPENPTGRLLAGFGLVALASELVIADAPAPYLLGVAADGLALPVFLHLLLAFPSGRLDWRASRVTVRAAYAVEVTVAAAQILLGGEPDEFGCANCPRNLVLLARRPDLVDTLMAAETVLGMALIAATIALMVRRWRSSTAFGRRALAPPAAVAVVILLLAVASALAQETDLPAGAKDAVQFSVLLAFGALPVAFLTGLVQVSYFRTARLSRLLGDLGRRPGASALQDALAAALGDPSLALAYWIPQRRGYVDVEGRELVLPAAGAERVATEIRHGGRRVGALVHAAGLRDEAGLVHAMTGAAALAVENGRLEAELRAQVQALRASRSRIVQAGDAERRRLGRDLHDGAQQRLVSILLRLQLADGRWQGAPEGRELVREALADARAAVEELRELAAGIHPAILAQRGLDAGLEALATRASLPVELDAELPDRLPETVERAAYFFVAEALTNVAKHARATHGRVRAHVDAGELVVEVADDGVGGADAGRGSGLQGLEDRLGAVAGSLEVVSPPGAGTRLRARIPLSDPAGQVTPAGT